MLLPPCRITNRRKTPPSTNPSRLAEVPWGQTGRYVVFFSKLWIEQNLIYTPKAVSQPGQVCFLKCFECLICTRATRLLLLISNGSLETRFSLLSVYTPLTLRGIPSSRGKKSEKSEWAGFPEWQCVQRIVAWFCAPSSRLFCFTAKKHCLSFFTTGCNWFIFYLCFEVASQCVTVHMTLQHISTIW